MGHHLGQTCLAATGDGVVGGCRGAVGIGRVGGRDGGGGGEGISSSGDGGAAIARGMTLGLEGRGFCRHGRVCSTVQVGHGSGAASLWMVEYRV